MFKSHLLVSSELGMQEMEEGMKKSMKEDRQTKKKIGNDFNMHFFV